jgi:phosphoglycerol transferase MdoB-like AlkP superfamily enzyme
MFKTTIQNFKLEPIYKVLILRLLLIYLFFTITRILFYIFNFSFFTNTGISSLPNIAIGGFVFDTVAILYTNSLFILLSIIPSPIRYKNSYQKVLKYLFLISNSIVIAANIIDISYFPYTLSRTTFSVFSQFSNESNLLLLLSRFFIDFWYIVLIYISIIWLFVFLYNKIKIKQLIEKADWKYYTKALILIPIIASIFVIAVRGGIRHSTRPITMSNAGDFVQNSSEIHLVLNTSFCIYKTIFHHSLEKKSYFADEKEIENIYSPIHISKGNDTLKKYNIVLIILESFGKESIGYFNKNLENGNYKGFTPFIDSLCEKSLVFENSFANGRKSIDILPTTLASIPSIGEPFVLTEYFNNNYKSLPQILAEEKYETSFFHGAANGSMGFSAFTNLIGIKNYFGMNEFYAETRQNQSESENLWGIWDETFFQFFVQKLNQFKEPFFASIFSASSHHPFDLPEKYEGKFPEGKQPINRCIAYTDYSLKKFFETSSKMPWFKNTIFIITADHCQSTPSHDEYNTTTGLFSVPIIFYSPNDSLNLKGNSQKLIQQIDIMPTLLSLINYKKTYFAFGDDAINSENHFLINYINGIYQVFYNNFVLHFDGKKTIAIFDFKNDILLKNNLKEKNQEIEQKMENFAKAFVQQYNNRIIDNKMEINPYSN